MKKTNKNNSIGFIPVYNFNFVSSYILMLKSNENQLRNKKNLVTYVLKTIEMYIIYKITI